jgi:hypothetical protein
MAAATATPTKKPAWRNSPGVWFSMLCNAIAEHNFDLAAEAQENLQRLGVSVRFRNLQSVVNTSSSLPAEDAVYG